MDKYKTYGTIVREVKAAALAAAFSSPSPDQPGEGLEGGSNGGTPPLPAAFRHVTEGVAGEDIGDTSNLVFPNATKPSTQSCDWMQLRMRLPREFAEILLAFKSEKRAVALWLALEGRIGDVWDLPKLIKSSANLWTAGTLLNQRLRHIGLGGHDWVQLKLAVSVAVRAIKKLRTNSAPAGKQDGTSPAENPATALAVPKATKRSLQSGDWVQIRLRVPLAFAEVLWATRCEKRPITLWVRLEGRIGCVWDLPQLVKSAADLRRVGVLLNQALRYCDERGEEWVELKKEVTNILREIKKLRPPNIPAEKSEARPVVKAWENAWINAMINSLIDVLIDVLKAVRKGGWKILGKVAGKNVGGRTKNASKKSSKRKLKI